MLAAVEERFAHPSIALFFERETLVHVRNGLSETCHSQAIRTAAVQAVLATGLGSLGIGAPDWM